MAQLSIAVRPEEIRRHNLRLLLRQVHLHGELSRAELTHAIGLNRSTIGTLVGDLVDQQLLEEHRPATRTGAGRPSHVVGPRPDGPFVLAAAVGVESLSTAAIGLGGTVLSRRDQALEGRGSMPSAVAGRIVAELRQHLRQAPEGARLVGVGVSVPGVVRETDGLIELAPNLKWHSVPFASMIADRLPSRAPVRIGNDADLGALAEHVRGAATAVQDLVYLAGHVGVGGGIITGGATLRGSGGYAGEIGHMLVDPLGEDCGCGSAGCFETKVGEMALLRACGVPGHGRQAVETAYQRAREGDPAARAGVDDVARWLGRGLASVVNVFNPRMIIVGGSLAGLIELARPIVEAQLDRHVMHSMRAGLQLRLPALGADSSLFGAMEIGFDALLEDPTSLMAAR